MESLTQECGFRIYSEIYSWELLSNLSIISTSTRSVGRRPSRGPHSSGRVTRTMSHASVASARTVAPIAGFRAIRRVSRRVNVVPRAVAAGGTNLSSLDDAIASVASVPDRRTGSRRSSRAADGDLPDEAKAPITASWGARACSDRPHARGGRHRGRARRRRADHPRLLRRAREGPHRS